MKDLDDDDFNVSDYERRKRKIHRRFMIGFGLNCNGVANHFWMTDLRNELVMDWGETIFEVIQQIPQQWQPAKWTSTDSVSSIPVDSYQVLDVTIQGGKFIRAFLQK